MQLFTDKRPIKLSCPQFPHLFTSKKSKNLLGDETFAIDYVTVEDNGIGFTSENLRNFKELANKDKGLNNRGTGTVQVFCRFNTMEIDSTFIENGKWNSLNVSWRITGEYEDTLLNRDQAENKTIVKMSGFSGDIKEQEFYLRYLTNIDELKRDILKHFLLRLWRGSEKELKLTMRTFLDDSLLNEYTFQQSNIPAPDKQETIEISTEKAEITTDKKDKSKINIEWLQIEPKYKLIIHRFKIPSTDMDENAVYLCNKDIKVEAFKFSAIKRKDAVFSGFRYLSSVRGELFDKTDSVNQAVDKFIFPIKKDIENDLKDGITSMFNLENKFVFRDEINAKIGAGLAKVYDDVKGLKEKREEDIAALAQQYGISLEDAEAAPIAFNDSEEEATEKLFETQAKHFAHRNIEIQKTYEEIKILETQKLDPTSEEYRAKFNELSSKLLEKIPQQNKDELTRYIIRRDMVVDLLKLALNNELAIQKTWEKDKKAAKKGTRKDKEGIIHDLIFKRRMKGVPNDLWILNEEFVHFDGCSEMELNQLEINGEKLLRADVDIDMALQSVGIEIGASLEWRPDIFLYPEEGKCVLVEFKAPDVEMSKHCDQIQKYAKIIANYANKQFTQFFGFLIGEQINPLAVPDRYKKAPYGKYWVYPNEPINKIETGLHIADLYQEIIPLSEIAKRAELRNRSFAQKLGITSDDMKKIKGDASENENGT